MELQRLARASDRAYLEPACLFEQMIGPITSVPAR